MRQSPEVTEINNKIGAIIKAESGYHGEGYVENVKECLSAKRELSEKFLDGKLKKDFPVEFFGEEEKEEATAEAVHLIFHRKREKLLDSKEYKDIITKIKNTRLPAGDRLSPLNNGGVISEEEKLVLFKESFYRNWLSKSRLSSQKLWNQIALNDWDKLNLVNSTDFIFPIKEGIEIYISSNTGGYHHLSFLKEKYEKTLSQKNEFLNRWATLKEITSVSKSKKLTKKAYAYYKEVFGEKYASFAIDMLSIVIQQYAENKSQTGVVTLSVDPVDFAAISVTDGWSSCLNPDGEYAISATSFMLDSSTMVAYIKSKNGSLKFYDENNKAYEIPNKKSRAMIHSIIDDGYGEQQGFIKNKTYPHKSQILETFFTQFCESNGFVKEVENYNITFEESKLIYSDFDSYPEPKALVVDEEQKGELIVAIGSQEVYCHHCGEVVYGDIEDDERMEEESRGLCYECACSQ